MHALALVALVAMLFAIQVWRSIGTSIDDAASFDAVDLRERVVGTRALSRHLDPYRLHPNVPEVADPCASGVRSRATNPPTAYLLSVPIAHLPYADAKRVWLVVEWLSLAIALAAMMAKRGADSTPLVAVFALLWLPSPAWRLHMERGQLYITLLAIFACAVTLHVRSRKPFAGGLLYGVAMALKIVPLVLLLPLAIARQWRAAIGAVVGASATVAVAIWMWGTAPWFAYRQVIARPQDAIQLGLGAACRMFLPPGLINASLTHALAFGGADLPASRASGFALAALAMAAFAFGAQHRDRRELDETWWAWIAIFLNVAWAAAPVYWRYQECLWLLVVPTVLAIRRNGPLPSYLVASGSAVVTAVFFEVSDDRAMLVMGAFLATLGWACRTRAQSPSDA